MNFTEHVKIRKEKFGTVIFETLREKVFVTNKTGGDILGLLQAGHSTEEIVESLANSYGIKPADIQDDIVSFVGQLKDNGILTQQTQ